MTYEEDKIFLLSIEEYKKYKNKIPFKRYWWWLRTPSPFKEKHVDFILDEGSTSEYGLEVYYDMMAVRPAVKIDSNEDSLVPITGEVIVYCGITWVKLDDNLYIAENPIDFRRFDKDTNEYKVSEIRQFLLSWYNSRRSW